MFDNCKISESLALLDAIAPASQGPGTFTTGWISGSLMIKGMAVISTGVLGAADTVDAKIQQAQDSSGTGAKDVTGKFITQIVKATGDNKIAIINFRIDDLDVNGNFGYFRLSLTVGGGATSQVAAHLFGTPRELPADVFNSAAVVQIV